MKSRTLGVPGRGSLLDRIRCLVFVTGAQESLYLDVSAYTSAVYEGLRNLKEGNEKQLRSGMTSDLELGWD
ncbi:hypothetical protein B0T14DRAFT_563972 [Immersiella caudata]|uniref:Uncharacterized protein n=1 Tax=Immersiella caudata TaxID=314043 RepID=A0AA39WVS2_9PEZI|nr:hypothetical protein B0T14DRAFT_563972 [Immersiella caudata]